MQGTLVIVGSKKDGMEIPLFLPRFLIGSEAGCQFRVINRNISPRHCLLIMDQESFAVEDCGSANGTFVNGERLSGPGKRTLQPGDRLTVGPLELEFRPGIDAKQIGEDVEAAILHWLDEGDAAEVEDMERYWRKAAAKGHVLSEMGDGDFLDDEGAARGGNGEFGGGGSGGDGFGQGTAQDAVSKRGKPKKKGWATKMGSVVAFAVGPIYYRYKQLDLFERLLLAAILLLAMVVIMVMFPVTFVWFKAFINVPKWHPYFWAAGLTVILGYLFWLREQYE
jgi:pSer/pThr/pTyr-binding forkhead associated (FHA) protein